MKNNLLGKTQGELMELAQRLGEPAFRGKQLYHQIYVRREFTFSLMTELPIRFRERLSSEFRVSLPKVFQRSQSADGTVKFLFELEDGGHIEAVYIPEERRQTLCISSQVGCGVGCTFCLTAQMGFKRNLKPGEIVGQVLAVIADGSLPPQGFNIVYMGMGEPLYNFKHVMASFHLLVDQQGMDLSARRITVSTSGVVPVLERLLKEPVAPNVAVSLNATTDPERTRIMPLNERWKLDDLMKACSLLPADSRRRITFEYVLLAGVNDRDEDARRLLRLVRGTHSKINLIPYNPNPGLPYSRPAEERIARFKQILVDGNLTALVRRPRGDDISAACGQLAYLERAEIA